MSSLRFRVKKDMFFGHRIVGLLLLPQLDPHSQQCAVLWFEWCKVTQSVAFSASRNFCMLAQHVFLSFSLLVWLGHSGVASGPHVARHLNKSVLGIYSMQAYKSYCIIITPMSMSISK